VSMCYSRSGEPMTQDEWLRAWSTERNSVAKTTVGDADVSTVWLGLDHRFGAGPPLIFETMVFGGEHDQGQWRYSTEEQALAGHERVVKALEEGRDPDA
jgi:hypothetical protein